MATRAIALHIGGLCLRLGTLMSNAGASGESTGLLLSALGLCLRGGQFDQAIERLLIEQPELFDGLLPPPGETTT